jgi:lipoate-protein ligase B
MTDLWVCELGLVPYREALSLQEAVRAARQADAVPDVLLLLEHPPVYTRGRRTEPGELPFADDWYAARGIEIVDVDRGGKLTYHGPGQLVGYPIVRLGGVVEFLRTMESAIVGTLAGEGIEARGADERPTGVWVGERKIASLGIHVQRRVSTHGFAINVENDLEPFTWIVPCGLEGVQITSVARETGATGRMRCVRRRVAYELASALGRRQRLVSRARLEAAVAPAVAA